jgi:hypothetical protein
MTRSSTPPRPTFVLHLRLKPGIDPIKALRCALKILGRRFGLRAIEVREERKT